MNCCHGNNDRHGNADHHGNHKEGRAGHMWMMLLCCGAPILLLFLLPLISNAYPGAGVYISKIIPFLCPLMMVAMIPMMFRKDKGDTEKNRYESESIRVEEDRHS